MSGMRKRVEGRCDPRGKGRKCENCGFIDWDNWVYVACVAVAFNDRDEFLMVRLKGKKRERSLFREVFGIWVRPWRKRRKGVP